MDNKLIAQKLRELADLFETSNTIKSYNMDLENKEENKDELATLKQKKYIKDLGGDIPEGLTKLKAGEIIKALKGE